MAKNSADLAVPKNSKNLVFQVFDPSPCKFPAPRLSLLATLEPSQFAFKLGKVFRRIGDGREQRHYTRGRYALREAYRLAGVGSEGALLAPAYHCRTMLDPAVRLGGEIGLYRLRPDLSPDLDSLTLLCMSSSTPVRALLLTHYFGFAQDTEEIREFCKLHDICLIEDCSHALFNSLGSTRIGSAGQYVVISPYKFFPSPDGGSLLAAPDAPFARTPLPPPSLTNELRGIVHAFEWRNQAMKRPVNANDSAAALASTLSAGPGSIANEFSDSGGSWSAMYDSEAEYLSALRISRMIWRFCDEDLIAESRRANYRALCSAMMEIPNCRPLFPVLPTDCVPYMFPLLIDRPQSDFALLKRLGVPIWRWDEMAISECSVAADYRLRLLHLPCHQSLSTSDIDWMVATLRLIMMRKSSGDVDQAREQEFLLNETPT